MEVEARVSSFTKLPSELLHQVFVLLAPRDISVLCQTCHALNEHISASDHLWKQVYQQRWDEPRRNILDPLLTQQCPHTKPTPSAKGKDRVIPPEHCNESAAEDKKLFLSLASYDQAGTFDYKTQVQRRTWAEHRTRCLEHRPIDLVSNYNDTMQTLLSIARSRQFRSEGSRTETSPSCRYLIGLLTSNKGCETFKKLIYPRSDITRLRDWQMKTLLEKHGKDANEVSVKKGDTEKRNRSTSSTSNSREVKRRKPNLSGKTYGSRRRSARLLLHAYPPELHHFFYDRNGNNVIDLESGQGVTSFEELDLLDEQLAAELHVLHGIRPSKPSTSNSSKKKSGGDESVSSFDGTENTDGTDEDEMDGGEGEENGNDEEDAYFHHHHHHHHLLFEQALGSENGYEGDALLRGRAREIVYDTANYGSENSYGPLRAWRERYEPIDGRRPEDRLTRENDDEEITADGEEDDDDGSVTPIVDLTNESSVEEEFHEMLEEIDSNEPEADDANFEADTDFDEDDDDDDEEEDILLMEVREIAIALSHGLYPFHESKRLKRAMLEYDLKTGRQRKWTISSEAKSSDVKEESSLKSLQSVWRIEKRIDWVIVEAVMIVMSCNLRHAIANHGWGNSFRLPDQGRSLTDQDQEARRLYNEQSNGYFRPSRQNLLCLPCGWNHSRGDEKRIGVDLDRKANVTEDGQQKPFDWAAVESTWIGTYAFLDWSKWANYNARDPLTRGLSESLQSSDPTKPIPLGNPSMTPSLRHEREAVGDCLQLRMELLPMAEQKPANLKEKTLEELEGLTDDAKYPPLRFRGVTVTYGEEDGPPSPRGQVHGLVSPVYATQDEEYYRKDDGGDKVERAIVGLHWQLTHAYDGEDRWSLSGIQPGPPGSRAPIYGVWGSSDRTDDLSPCGPFIYLKVLDTPWKEVDRLLHDEMERRK